MAADFEAAFETVSWSYLRAVIKEMNFGNKFIKTMDIMYRGLQLLWYPLRSRLFIALSGVLRSYGQ